MPTRNIYIENESAKLSAPLAEISFNSTHYLPILKTKEGELWALGNTSSLRKPFITPLLELHVGPPSKSAAEHAASVCDQVKQAWSDRRFFLDTCLHGQTLPNHVTVCTATLNAAVAEQLNFVPVISLASSIPFMTAVQPFTADHRGLMVRLRAADFVDMAALSQNLHQILIAFSLTPADVDILIDYGAIAESAVVTQLLALHINQLPLATAWRTLTVAGGSFPTSIANHAPHVWHSLPRHEWAAWQVVSNSAGLVRKPTFGDYGTRDTLAPASMGFPYPSIRYTSNGSFLVRRHDVLVKDGGSPGVRSICSSITQHTAWRGTAFSEGDARIAANVMPSAGPGNAGNWTAWAMNHHFASVVDEIQNLP